MVIAVVAVNAVLDVIFFVVDVVVVDVVNAVVVAVVVDDVVVVVRMEVQNRAVETKTFGNQSGTKTKSCWITEP